MLALFNQQIPNHFGCISFILSSVLRKFSSYHTLVNCIIIIIFHFFYVKWVISWSWIDNAAPLPCWLCLISRSQIILALLLFLIIVQICRKRHFLMMKVFSIFCWLLQSLSVIWQGGRKTWSQYYKTFFLHHWKREAK